MSLVLTELAADRSVSERYSLGVCSLLAWRVSATSMLWKPASKRQADGRYGVGGGKAERAARFASTLGPGRKTL
jgi:hypothetical protein